jgi:hypothetical protein
MASSTGAVCRRWRIPGSRYCIFHVEKGPILVAGLIGAVLSLVVADTYHSLVPSAESRQLTATGQETAGLRQQIGRLQARVEEEQKRSVDREQLHLAQVTELNARLGPFVRAATAKYPNMGVDQALKHLRDDLDQVRELAAPAVLSLGEHTVQRTSEGYILGIQFKKSKNAPLGRLAFDLVLVPGSAGRIRDVRPTGAAAELYVSVAPDGSKAKLEYSALGGDPGLVVALSGPARVRVVGNNGLQPILLEAR